MCSTDKALLKDKRRGLEKGSGIGKGAQAGTGASQYNQILLAL